MSEIKHPPIPYSYTYIYTVDENIHVYEINYGMDGECVAETTHGEQAAKFFVTACNAWYDVEALKKRIQELEA